MSIGSPMDIVKTCKEKKKRFILSRPSHSNLWLSKIRSIDRYWPNLCLLVDQIPAGGNVFEGSWVSAFLLRQKKIRNEKIILCVYNLIEFRMLKSCVWSTKEDLVVPILKKIFILVFLVWNIGNITSTILICLQILITYNLKYVV